MWMTIAWDAYGVEWASMSAWRSQGGRGCASLSLLHRRGVVSDRKLLDMRLIFPIFPDTIVA